MVKKLKRPKIIFLLILLFSLIMVISLASDVAIGQFLGPKHKFPYDKLDSHTRDFSTNLPIFVLETDVSELYNGSKSNPSALPPLATIWVFDNGVNNRLTNTPAYSFVNATANYRGHSSIGFPKKPYKIKLYDNLLDKSKHDSFLGLPPASDWVLRSPYADKSLLRDWFAYEIAATVLEWQPRGGMVQLFLKDGENGEPEYQGVYFLCEYVTVGKNRLDLGDFNLDSSDSIDFAGGGYLFQRDRPNRGLNFISFPDNCQATYRLMYPTINNLNLYENMDFRNEVIFYHDLLTRTGRFSDVPPDEWNFRDYIDVNSFIDYILVGELLKTIDAGQFSSFMYRPVGEKLRMGPLWDCDFSMGNIDYYGTHFDGFPIMNRHLFIQLSRDDEFATNFVDRYISLRAGLWSDDFIFGLFDSMVEYLTEAAVQEAERWPEKFDGQTYIIPNPEPYTTSWEEEIIRTRQWLENRISWLDEYVSQLVK